MIRAPAARVPAGVVAVGVLLTALISCDAWAAPRTGTLAAEVLRECPAKRLDWLNPGILIDGVEAFQAGLPPRGRARLEARAAPALARCEAGASCVNAAYAGAARALGSTPQLLQAICALPYRCTAPFDCTGD